LPNMLAIAADAFLEQEMLPTDAHQNPGLGHS
jgi:hypothetical protein